MRYQLIRLPHTVKVQIKYSHYQAYDRCQYSIGCKAVFKRSSYLADFVLSEQTAHNGRQSIGKSCTEDNGKIEHVIDEAGSSQFCRTVMSDHQRISKSQYDNSYLPNDNRKA